MKRYDRIGRQPQVSWLEFRLRLARDVERRTIWIVDAHRGDGKRSLCADEKLTAFFELESAIRSVGKTVRGTYLLHRHTERSFIADGRTAFLYVVVSNPGRHL